MKKYNIKNYVRYKEDLKRVIESVKQKRFVSRLADNLSVCSSDKLSLCSVIKGINNPMIPNVIPMYKSMVKITASVFGNFNFFRRNRISGLAISDITAAIQM